MRSNIWLSAAGALALGSFATQAPSDESALAENSQEPLKSLAAYKSWHRANPQPVMMSAIAATLCRPTPESMAKSSHTDSPHRAHYLTTYVNAIGKAEFMTKLVPKFPVGTMIVKEKLAHPRAKAPELLTAMLKREAGYDPSHGDWEYLVLTGTAEKILERGKLKACRSSHSSMSKSGFLFRGYLPQTLR